MYLKSVLVGWASTQQAVLIEERDTFSKAYTFHVLCWKDVRWHLSGETWRRGMTLRFGVTSHTRRRDSVSGAKGVMSPKLALHKQPGPFLTISRAMSFRFYGLDTLEGST